MVTMTTDNAVIGPRTKVRVLPGPPSPSTTYVRFSHCIVTILLVGLASACGGQPTAGPSPIADGPPPATVTAPAARALPAGLDPAYVRALATIDADGRPKRWEGGPFRHCFGPGLEAYRAFLDRVADRMTAITGIPRTESGACN